MPPVYRSQGSASMTLAAERSPNKIKRSCPAPTACWNCSTSCAAIDGEAGFGYVLKPGFLLPPLMFSQAEIEALVLGSRWVAKRGDAELAGAATRALAKIKSVLPAELREEADAAGLMVGPGETV